MIMYWVSSKYLVLKHLIRYIFSQEHTCIIGKFCKIVPEMIVIYLIINTFVHGLTDVGERQKKKERCKLFHLERIHSCERHILEH